MYRALNPVYARDPLSGRGAQIHGGRFNPKGTAALYTALSPATAIREANQVGTLQPTVLVAYQGEIEPVFDTRDGALMARYGVTAEDLARNDWRDRMGAAPSQMLALRLIADGFWGLLVRSYAPGAAAADLNLVLWRWDGLAGVDDENRLSRM